MSATPPKPPPVAAASISARLRRNLRNFHLLQAVSGGTGRNRDTSSSRQQSGDSARAKADSDAAIALIAPRDRPRLPPHSLVPGPVPLPSRSRRPRSRRRSAKSTKRFVANDSDAQLQRRRQRRNSWPPLSVPKEAVSGIYDESEIYRVNEMAPVVEEDDEDEEKEAVDAPPPTFRADASTSTTRTSRRRHRPELEEFLERISLSSNSHHSHGAEQVLPPPSSQPQRASVRHKPSALPRQESVSVICHDSGFGDKVLMGGGAVEKYEEKIRVARRLLNQVNQQRASSANAWSARSRIASIFQHYYPEGDWGYVILFCAFLAQVCAHGVQLCYGSLGLAVSARFFRPFGVYAGDTGRN